MLVKNQEIAYNLVISAGAYNIRIAMRVRLGSIQTRKSLKIRAKFTYWQMYDLDRNHLRIKTRNKPADNIQDQMHHYSIPLSQTVVLYPVFNIEVLFLCIERNIMVIA